MRWPLELFALLVVLIQLLHTFAGDAWKAPAEGVRHVFIPFAGVAVLMIALGKPGLPAQYSAWAVFVLQVAYAVSALRHQALAAKITQGISLALVGFIWFINLPLFDAIPS